MPPAFNLSQDQTLQFNLCFVPLLAGPVVTRNRRSLKILTDRFLRIVLLLCCEHLLNNLSIRRCRRRTSSSAHTYRLLIVKEPSFCLRRPGGRGCEALCSSAAERQDYAVFIQLGQGLATKNSPQNLFLFFHSIMVRLAGIEPATLGFGGQYSIH